MQYLQDYDERFPLGLTPTNAIFSSFALALDLIQPYTKNTQVAICASDGAVPSLNLALPGLTPLSYSANKAIMTAPIFNLLNPAAYPDPLPAPAHLAEIRDGARLPLIWDAANVSADPSNPDIVAQRRHLEGANCAFVDGHVKWVKSHPELWATDEDINYWNAKPDAE